ncbi:hypothetical protein ACJX0J_021128, partial [Zea mays]
HIISDRCEQPSPLCTATGQSGRGGGGGGGGGGLTKQPVRRAIKGYIRNVPNVRTYNATFQEHDIYSRMAVGHAAVRSFVWFRFLHLFLCRFM